MSRPQPADRQLELLAGAEPVDNSVVWCAHEWCPEPADLYVPAGDLWWPYCFGHGADGWAGRAG